MTASTVSPVSRSCRFRAMGSDATILVVSDPQRTTSLLDHGVRRVRQLEACWSRFEPTSDISRLNRASETAVAVHPDTTRLIVAMVDGWRASGGAYDPTLLGALNALGYAANWADPLRPSCSAAGVRRGDPAGILVDPWQDLVHLPFGTALDAGGIGKGLAADLVAEELLEAGAEGALVNIGGDLRACGRPLSGDGWRIGVAAPTDDATELARLDLLDGGVATSSTQRRRWQQHGVPVHHLLDPTTGLPARLSVVQATVVAGTGAWAEVWSTAVMVNGPAAVFPQLDALGVAAMAVGSDGSLHCSASWSRYAAAGAEVVG